MAEARQHTIEKLLSDDTGGSVFRATDELTHKLVALRRLAPANILGRNLNAKEVVAYQVACERLTRIRHHALWPIVSGYCQSDNDTPYLAAEWVDTEPLLRIIQERPLHPETTTRLILEMLEVCELLSHVFAEEGIWIETELETIAVAGHGSHDRFLFWPSPLKWLSGNDQARGLSSLETLARQLMGWHPGDPPEGTACPIATWLEWLQQQGTHSGTTLREAREMLAATAGIEPPAPLDALVQKSKRRKSLSERLLTMRGRTTRRLKMPLFVILSGMLVIETIAGWLWIRKINHDASNTMQEINLSIHDNPYAASVNESDPPEEIATPKE